MVYTATYYNKIQLQQKEIYNIFFYVCYIKIYAVTSQYKIVEFVFVTYINNQTTLTLISFCTLYSLEWVVRRYNEYIYLFIHSLHNFVSGTVLPFLKKLKIISFFTVIFLFFKLLINFFNKKNNNLIFISMAFWQNFKIVRQQATQMFGIFKILICLRRVELKGRDNDYCDAD